jgi:hypothetical protein
VLLEVCLASAPGTALADTSAASAQQGEATAAGADSAPSEASAEPRVDKKSQKHKRQKQPDERPGVLGWLNPPAGKAGKLEVHGRVFARAAFSQY